MQHWNKLEAYLKEIAYLGSIQSLLHWDQSTFMPKQSVKVRSEQLSVLGSILHHKKTNKDYSDILGKCIELGSGEILLKDADDSQKANLRELLKDYKKSCALPQKFIEEETRHASQSMHAWEESKKCSDFGSFAPYLDMMVDYQKQKADYLGYEEHPYDALLDLYDPGFTTSELDSLFTELNTGLTKILSKTSLKWDNKLKDMRFPIDKQVKFGNFVLEKLGVDWNHLRLDTSAHPFTCGHHPEDVRITTRYSERDLFDGLSSSIHELGHAFYESGLNKQEFGLPLGSSVSTGWHESQSRFYENIVGRSYEFWEYFYPSLQKEFFELKDISFTDFYKSLNCVKPDLIRVEADEVTYNLHIMIRFELEKKLINNELSVNDLPEAWNEMMTNYLGVTPKDDAYGVLQDIHWSSGGIGYFPSYTLGNLISVQLANTMNKDLSIGDSLSEGNFLSIKQWLNSKVHQKGRFYSPKDLIKHVTGEVLSPKPFLDHIDKKYDKILKM